MEKLATYVVREGALQRLDAVGWVARLTISLQVLHGAGVAHGRISAKAIDVLGPNCRTGAFFLDAPELLDELSYQSPERLAGAPPSAADDVWATGVLLYQLLTGSLPFEGSSAPEIARRIAIGPPAPLAPHSLADEPLQRVVTQLLDAGSPERLRSVVALRQQLLSYEPRLASLAPLRLGKPGLHLFDVEETADDAGEKLTAVISRDRIHAGLQAWLEADQGKRRAASGAAGAHRGGDAAATPPVPVGGRGVAWPASAAAERGGGAAVGGAESGGGRRRAGLRTVRIAAALLLMVVGGAAAVQVYRPTLWRRLAGERGTAGEADGGIGAGVLGAPTAAARGGPPERRPAASSSTAAAPSSTELPAPGSSGAGSSRPPQSLRACMVALVGADSMGGGVASWRPLCRERHARRGGTRLRAEVTRAGGGVPHATRAMREWDQLGWYEMAAFAVARQRCCSDPPPLRTPLGFDACPLDRALDRLGRAAQGDDAVVLQRAQHDFDSAVHCIIRYGAARFFGRRAPPTKAARAAFARLLARHRDTLTR